MPAQEKVILVTGASTGIGRATALRLARAGHTVYAGIRRDADGARLLAALDDGVRDGEAGDGHAGGAVSGGGTLVPLHLDVTDAAQVAAAAARLAEDHGHLDALVNNAGIGLASPVECVDLVALRRQFEVNVFGQVAVTQAMLPLVRQARGRVVTIGSVGSWITMPFGGPLCASKHAIRSLNDALRMELSPWGIECVLVEPGSIRTPAVDKVEADAERVQEAMGPAGRALYGDAYGTMIARAMAHERTGSDPDVVARVVERALTARRPRARYPAGKGARTMGLMARVLPQRLLDRLRLKVLGIDRARLPEAAAA